jgi:hypothetical protein
VWREDRSVPISRKRVEHMTSEATLTDKLTKHVIDFVGGGAPIALTPREPESLARKLVRIARAHQ